MTNHIKYFFDTEFIENGRTIDLISIGIVCEDGREFYCYNLDCDHTQADDWVKENVLKYLPEKNLKNIAMSSDNIFSKYSEHKRISLEILKFCSIEYGKPEFWAYYADYDWVALCQLFGRMIDLPTHFPMYCNDLKQEVNRLGNPKLPEQKENEHNALEDARWVKNSYLWLQQNYKH